MSDDAPEQGPEQEGPRPWLERMAQAFEETQHRNAKTMDKLHSLATTRSVLHLLVAIVAIFIAGGLLYLAQSRMEERALRRWEDLAERLSRVPAETASRIEFRANQTVTVETGALETHLAKKHRERMEEQANE